MQSWTGPGGKVVQRALTSYNGTKVDGREAAIDYTTNRRFGTGSERRPLNYMWKSRAEKDAYNAYMRPRWVDGEWVYPTQMVPVPGESVPVGLNSSSQEAHNEFTRSVSKGTNLGPGWASPNRLASYNLTRVSRNIAGGRQKILDKNTAIDRVTGTTDKLRNFTDFKSRVLDAVLLFKQIHGDVQLTYNRGTAKKNFSRNVNINSGLYIKDPYNKDEYGNIFNQLPICEAQNFGNFPMVCVLIALGQNLECNSSAEPRAQAERAWEFDAIDDLKNLRSGEGLLASRLTSEDVKNYILEKAGGFIKIDPSQYVIPTRNTRKNTFGNAMRARLGLGQAPVQPPSSLTQANRNRANTFKARLAGLGKGGSRTRRRTRKRHSK